MDIENTKQNVKDNYFRQRIVQIPLKYIFAVNQVVH